MNFALSDEHILLRDSAADFVDRETDHQPLLVPGATAAQADYAEHWRQLCALGWPGLLIDEEYGGAGLGPIELAVIATELGRRLYPCPFAGHSFGTWALMLAGSDAQREQWLPGAASGDTVLAFVPPVDGNQVRAVGDVLSGSHDFVIDAAAAHALVVAVPDATGMQFFLVDCAAAGVSIEPIAWRDITRQVCRVRFDQAPAAPMPGSAAVWPRLLDRILCLQAAENLGGLRQVLTDAVDYANERVAFGRPIGAYQAIKHPLAELKGKLECASSAVLFAAWTLACGDARAAEAASMAKAYSSAAYCDATHRSIQIFGAIGFTWEMKNHLYFKRARANAVLFGDARVHRERVINSATGRRWASGEIAGALSNVA